jgi:3-hydroxymyristoyl/3-hydroxydecanoyl-(acyl carrier protein) dehydratase
LLPHEYPFRLLDRRADGTVVVLVSGNAAQVRGAEELPAFLAVEVLAQSALFALVESSGERDSSDRGLGLLAGVQDVQFHAPLRPGDRLSVAATLLARLGALSKVRAELRRGDELVVEGELLLAMA